MEQAAVAIPVRKTASTPSMDWRKQEKGLARDAYTKQSVSD